MQIVKAEAITCEIITDNNLSLSTANPLSRSFKVMFLDSKIAAGMFTKFLNCVQSFLFVLAFRLRQSKMFDASYDGLHLSTQNYTYPH